MSPDEASSSWWEREAGHAFRRVLFCALILTSVGWVTIHAVCQQGSFEHEPPYSQRQLLYVAAALGAGCATSALGWRFLLRRSRILLLLTMALLVAVKLRLLPASHGRWLRLGSLASFQPSEAAKLFTLLHVPLVASLLGERLASFRRGMLPVMAWVGATVVLVMIGPDLGQSLLLLVSGCAVALAMGMRVVHLLPVGGLGLGAIALMSACFPYVRNRLASFEESLQVGVDPGSQVGQGLVALARGGLFGRGLGAGEAHLGFVSEIHNDFVLTAVGEQLGLLGTFGVVVVMVLLVDGLFRIGRCAGDPRAAAIGFGLAFTLGLQAAINLAVVTGSAPPKGMSLPFVSYGGSGLLVAGAMLGLAASIARDGDREEICAPASAGGPAWRRFLFPLAPQNERSTSS